MARTYRCPALPTAPQPIDRLCVFWYSLIAIVCIVDARVLPEPMLQICFFAGSAVFFLVLPKLLNSRGRRTQIFARAAIFCLLIPITFEMVGRAVPHVSPDARDSWLKRADVAVFGGDPTRWTGEREAFPWATELLQLVYASFYFLSPVLAIRLFYLKKIEAIANTMLVVVAGFLISYLGYFLVPGRSPYHLYNYPFEFRGLFATPLLRDAIQKAESTRFDAFPSGHCEVTWLVAACAWRHDRRIFYIFFLPVAVLLPISTIYLRYHFGVDLLAAVPFALTVWFLCNRLDPSRGASPP